MDKENGETSENTTGSTSKETSSSNVPTSAASLLDPANLFGAYWPQADSRSNAASLFAAAAAAGAGANTYSAASHPALASHHAAAAAAAAAGLPFGLLSPATAAAAAAASDGRQSATSAAYTNTLSVAASQAASLGINPAASAAWWSMASQLAAQNYLARLQASGLSFPSLGGPGDPYGALGLSSLGSLHKSTKSSSSKNGNSSSSLSSVNSSSKSSSKNRTSATALSIQAGAKLDGRLDPISSNKSSSRDPSAAYLHSSRHNPHKLPSKTPSGLTIQPTSNKSSSGQKRPRSPSSSRKPSPDFSLKDSYSKAQQVPLPKTSSMPKSSTPHMNTTSTSIFTSPLSLATSGNSERDTPERSASSTPGSGGSNSTGQSTTTTAVTSTITTSLPSNILSDPSSILGGVRLPPDTEIIKYTSSIVGPKIPGTTNRGRKKTISLDPPSVSVLPTHSSTGMLLERNKWTKLTGEDPQDFSKTNDRVEVIKLPATNGSPSGLNLTLSSSNNTETISRGGDAPLNLSLKPATSTSTMNCNNNSLNSLSNLSASIGADRISRRKPGPKPRRIIQSSSQILPSGSIPGAPSPSLAQLFAAADSPRPPSRNDDDLSTHSSLSMPQPSSHHMNQNHKDGRPRNLGRGVSKPKKNTVASLLAQSRALGIKPVQLDPNTPMNQQMSLLKNNILAAQQYMSEHATSSEDLKQLEKIRNALSDSSNMEVSTDSDNLTDSNQTDSEPDIDANGLSNPKKRRHYNERELRMPLDAGWKRETVIRGMSKNGRIIGDVYYTPPDSNTKFKQWTEVALYLEQTGKASEFTRDNFTFSSKIILGDYLQKPPPGATSEGEYLRLKEDELNRRLEDLQNLTRSTMSNLAVEQRIELARKQQAARAAARLDREQARIAREIERNEKQEAARRDREARTQQLMEGRKRLAFTLEQKMQIINEIEGGKTKSDVSRQMGLASSTVATIWKNRENILIAYGQNGNSNNSNENSIDDPLAKLKECLPPDTIIAGSPMAKRKRHEDLARQKQEEQQRKIQERELKKQQAAMIKEQIYIQEINKQREMLYTVELERERRRQHMSLVKALEARRKLEERERKKQQALLEKQASKERRMEQRKIDLELLQEIRKPCEDLELTHKPIPEFERIDGLKLSGQAFSDVLMVFEFLHNFGETLGFDMESLPTLLSLQQALLNESIEAEEELLSVMTHLLVCAIEDPGIPNPARHTTILGQSLRQADITHQNISEVLRIYLYANATGEVKTLAGVHFERDRERRVADHHQTDQEMQSTQSGKNAIYYEMLHENPTWHMSDSLKDKPFLGLNPTEKAAILAFLVNELLQNKAVIRQIESSMENVAHFRKERWLLDTKIRKVKMTYNRRIRMEAAEKLHAQVKLDSSDNNVDMDSSALGVDSPALQHKDELLEDMDDISENESEGTQPEEEEDKKLTCEEIGKKLEKLIKINETQLQQFNAACHQIRATCFGQDRYWRRYWSLPKAGGIFVEAMESSSPDVLVEQEKACAKNTLGINSVEDIKRIIHDAEAENINDPSVDKEVSNIVAQIENDKENEHRKTPNRFTDENKVAEIPSDDIPKKTEISEKDATVKTEENCEDANEKPVVKEENMALEEESKPQNVLKNLFQNLGENMEKENENKKCEIKLENLDIKQECQEDLKKLEIKEECKKEDLEEEKSLVDPNRKWFSILVKDGTTCDGSNLTSGNRWDTGIICTRENFGAELKIPVFPPPNCSNNYIYPTCDSPGPLQMTADESVQLEHIKTHGLPQHSGLAIVPSEFRYGWWRITDPEQMKRVLESLHTRGARERELKRYFQALMQNMYESSSKVQIEEGDKVSTSLIVPAGQEPETIANVDTHYGAPIVDTPGSLNSIVAERVDYSVLEQVEALEDKVANASMQIKGWRVPNRENEDVSPGSAMNVAKERLACLESAIERRYLKPPLGVRNVLVIDSQSDQNQNTQPPHQEDLNQSTMPEDSFPQNNGTPGSATPQQNNSSKDDKDKDEKSHDNVPKGLNVWREALQRSNTSAQVAMCLYMLESSIAWDKSIMKANCQFCHSGDNEDKLLLCDGCDKGYHTYCFRPKMDTIPEGNWYCYECINKATGDRNCIVCGKKQSSSGRLLQCEACPRAFHQDCINPPMLKAPRGKWYCSNCHGKAPNKKKARRTYNKQCRDSESSDHQPASPAPSHSSVTTNEDLTNQSTVSTPCKSTINEQPMCNSNCGGSQSTSSSPAGGSTPASTQPKKDRANKKLQKELAPCKILLEDLECHDDAWPFLLPVNTKQFPTYKKIINNPMDLSTIRKRLQDLQYKSREEFCIDVRQIFNNCETFNEDDSPVGKAGHCMRQFFEARWTELCALHVGKS